MKHEHGKTSLRTSSLALLSVALFTGCGADASTSTNGSSDDATLAYEALSAKIQACKDDDDTCVDAAAGDATKEAACETAKQACIDKTKTEQKQARTDLGRAAAGCFRDGDDDDAGPEGACGRRRHACLQQHTPNDSQCLESLFMCLEKKAGPGPQQDSGLNGCVDAAHACVMSNMSQRGSRGPGAGKPGAGGFGQGAGPGKPGSSSHGPGAAGSGNAGPSGPGGHAGEPAHTGGAPGGFGSGPGAAGGHAAPGQGAGAHAGAPAHAAGGAGGSWR